MEMPYHDGAHAMTRRRAIKKKPKTKKPTRRLTRAQRLRRRWWITPAEEQQLTGMMRKAGVYAFSDRVAELKKDSGVNPTRVREILVSPLEPLGTWRDIDQVQVRPTHYRAILDTLNIERDKREYHEVAARITLLEQQEARLHQTAQAIVPLGAGRRRPRWTVPQQPVQASDPTVTYSYRTDEELLRASHVGPASPP